MVGPLSYLDIALIALLFVSGLLAMYRGLARELLSIVSWAAAGAVGGWIFLTQEGFAADLGAQTGLPPKIALAVVAAVIALIVLIIVHLLTAKVSDAILDSRVGLIDRILGLLFGLARGFILIVVPFMFYESFVADERQQFDWVRNSKSLPYVKGTGDAIRTVLVDFIPSSLTEPPAAEQPAGPPDATEQPPAEATPAAP